MIEYRIATNKDIELLMSIRLFMLREVNNLDEDYQYSDELLDSLFYEVYTRINYIEDRCSVTRQTAATYLNSLVDAGLLEFEKVGRESIYKNIRLIDLLRKF